MDFQSARTLLLSSLAMGLICHILFSRFGFNPTDDGFILAYARRVLDGQIPHRDFISIRPVGSAYLHAPFLWLFGNYAYLFSRAVVWIQCFVASFVWVHLLSNALRVRFTLVRMVPLVFVSAVLSIQTFPIMAWHTIDGLFLVSVGVWLVWFGRSSWAAFGFFIIGCAALTRQNFAAAIPLALGLLIVRRDLWRYAAFSLLPILLYGVGLYIAGAMEDFWIQMSSHTSLAHVGWARYWKSDELWAGARSVMVFVWIPAAGVLAASRWWTIPRAIGHVFVGVLLIFLALDFAGFYPEVAFFRDRPYRLMGMLLVLWPLLGFFQDWERGALDSVVAIVLLVGLGWISSISIGYNTPVLIAGSFYAVLWMVALRLWDKWNELVSNGTMRLFNLAITVILLINAVWFAREFYIHRTEHIYRDLRAEELVQELDSVFPGGNGIFTNDRVHGHFREVDEWTKRLAGQRLAIIPDFPGYWAAARKANPLSIDWPQDTELTRSELVERVKEDMKLASDLVVLVQKYEAWALAGELRPLDVKRYPLVGYVESHFELIGESLFFRVFRSIR